MSLSFAQSHVLVVGGAGFVGSNLVKLLLADHTDIQVTVVDNLLSAERENLPDDDRLTFLHGSITDDAILARLEDTIDYVFHLATFHGNQSSIHDPLKDHENNTLTTLKLMHHLRDHKRLKKLVYSSAGCSVAEKTFGEAKATTEDDPITLDQDSPYSISKIVGEFYAVYFHKQNNLPTVRARFQNVFGPGEVLGAGEWRGTPATIWRNVTPTFIYKSMHGETLTVFGDATRDFIFVEDICRGLMACALKGTPGDVYNLASGKEVPIKELAQTINRLTGNEAEINLQPKRPWDTSGKRFGSNEKARRELGFAPSMDFEEGLRRTIAWFKENEAWIQQNMDKHVGHLTPA
ncbi:MAG: NAD-dependent epimerase/dehydratase family protein, partial [Bacteroidota bacterium]